MSYSALKFNHICFSYPGNLKALHDVSFEISAGERVALVGLNGSGKSTLLLTAAALITPDDGTVSINGEVISDKNKSLARQKTGIVFQNSDDQLFMPTVYDDVAFGPRNMGLENEEIRRRVDKALEQTGCGHLRDRSPFQLSGGQKKMVAIATVLSMQPEILVFDEPTSGLDYAATQQFLNIVESLPHTMLIASHDIDILKQLCNRALVMDKGKIIYDGNISEMPYPSTIKNHPL